MQGASGAFLQTSAWSVLKKLVLNKDMDDADRDTVTAFLTNDDSEAASGQIIGGSGDDYVVKS